MPWRNHPPEIAGAFAAIPGLGVFRSPSSSFESPSRDWQWPPRWDGDRDGPYETEQGRRWRKMTSREIVRELACHA